MIIKQLAVQNIFTVFSYSCKSCISKCTLCQLPWEVVTSLFLIHVYHPRLRVLSCKWVNFTIRANLLSSQPKSNTIVMEVMFANQLSYNITTLQLIYTNRTNKLSIQRLIFISYQYFFCVSDQLLLCLLCTRAICLSNKYQCIFLFKSNQKLLDSSLSDCYCFSNKTTPLENSKLKPTCNKYTTSKQTIKSIIKCIFHP